MSVTYFKRFRMELNLPTRRIPQVDLPSGYELIPWHESLVEAHADAKFRSFCNEIDSSVFPCLGELNGCYRLMNEIHQRIGFLPEATWLLAFRTPYDSAINYCGTVQGIVDAEGMGGIQNLGIVPEHRGQGLGTRLLYQALAGFFSAGLRRSYLEVTADNCGAVNLYRRLGFRRTKTIYKAVEVAYT